jgi:3-methylcrotonyl-CoA carboxylase alpha subunit
LFSTLLIANRGEIACRVAATARRLGIRTVAVYSDTDARAAHVAACDLAVRIGGPEPKSSYLRGDAVLQAARETGAQAIHPGYGFLSENEAFADAVAGAGLVFVGPPASAIAAMGSKSAAKALMQQAGVPLVPGYHGERQDMEFLRSQADAIGYPVLIKASAGGGGKGMRVVENQAAFAEALASCKREAASSFGDDRVLLERYLTKPRHVEIQVFADTQGNCVYLFERDCSVQRRHQKVIEEAPAPGMTAERRRAMGEAAVAAARAVGYVGAGTVEFIVEPGGRFYFMEMNTRLQVEHPITEMITGLDLVEWQLRVAAGQTLPARQEDLRIDGHAIECRIYAENPARGFLPSIGTLAHLEFPAHVAFTNGAVRVDGGVRTGDTISPYYDPMIAKLIVHGADRDEARRRMAQALAGTRIVGVQNNVAFLGRLMHDDAFATADLDTGLIERRRATLLPAAQPPGAAVLAAASAAVLAGEQGAAGAPDPWSVRDGWRVGGRYTRRITWLESRAEQAGAQPDASAQAARHDIVIAREGDGWTLDTGSGAGAYAWRAQPRQPAGAGGGAVMSWDVTVTLDQRARTMTVVMQGGVASVFDEDGVHELTLHEPLAAVDTDHAEHGGAMTAPMPGKIISIAVQPEQEVTKGQPLLVMEAMKMEHTITANRDGKVAEIFHGVGDQVVEGATLIALA